MQRLYQTSPQPTEAIPLTILATTPAQICTCKDYALAVARPVATRPVVAEVEDVYELVSALQPGERRRAIVERRAGVPQPMYGVVSRVPSASVKSLEECAVPAGEGVVDRLSELRERVTTRGRQDAAGPRPQVPEPGTMSASYRAVFGWSIRGDPEELGFEDATGDVIGHFVPDLQVAGESGVRPYIYVENVDATLAQVVAEGGEIVDAPYSEGDLWVATATASSCHNGGKSKPRPTDNGDRRWHVASPSTQRNTFQKQEEINSGRNAEADA